MNIGENPLGMDAEKMDRSSRIALTATIAISVGVLVVNDHFLKTAYHNELTGKLSDVFGLLAISLVGCFTFARHKTLVLAAIACLFTCWQTPLSSGFIDVLNHHGLPIGRTVDYTDLLTLPVVLVPVFIARYRRLRSRKLKLPVLAYLACLFAFVATTLPPREKRSYLDVDKSYLVELPLSAVVAKLNAYQNEGLKKYTYYVDYSEDEDAYYSRVTNEKVAQLIDHRTLEANDTVSIGNAMADILLYADGEGSTTVRLVNVYQVVPLASDKNYKDRAVRTFEKDIIKPLEREAERLRKARAYD